MSDNQRPRPMFRNHSLTAPGLALLIAWLSASMVFLSLARPVRDWAGEAWIRVPVVAVALLLLGGIGAYGLWTQRRWALLAVNVWSGSVMMGGALIVLGRDAVNAGSLALLGVVLAAVGVLNGCVRRLASLKAGA